MFVQDLIEALQEQPRWRNAVVVKETGEFSDIWAVATGAEADGTKVTLIGASFSPEEYFE